VRNASELGASLSHIGLNGRLIEETVFALGLDMRLRAKRDLLAFGNEDDLPFW
jgi:hypothetical protein